MSPQLVPALFDPARLVAGLAWEDYGEQGRVGARIHRIYRTPGGGPLAAIVHFLPGASAPLHLHSGYENILVLQGSYRDETGSYGAGDLVVYPPGSRHAWWSDEGALMYVVWSAPTVLIARDDEQDEEQALARA